MHTALSEEAITASSRIVNRFRGFSQVAGILVVGISLIALSGWVLDVDILKSLIPGRVTLKPNTALGLIASGTTLTLWHWQLRLSPGRLNRWITRGLLLLSGLVIGLGLVTLAEYGLSLDTGLNQLPFGKSPTPEDALVGGRPAPNTALSFVLMGSALLVLLRRRYRAAQGASAIAFLIALLAFTGHLYTVTDFYRVGSPTGMAIHTAIAFLLLSLGVLSAVVDKGWIREISSEYAGSIMMRRVMPWAITLPPLLGVLVLLIYDNLPLSGDTLSLSKGAFALLSVLSVAIFSAIVWWNGRSLNRIDHQRQVMQRQFNQKLEAQVEERTAKLNRLNRALSQEIAERERTELALNQASIQLEAALSAGSIYTWQWQPSENRVIVDRNLAHLFSVDPDRAADGLPIEVFLRAIHPEDRDRIGDALERAIATGQDYQAECRIQNAAGAERWVLARGRADRGADGRVAAFVGALVDITQRRQMEAALRQSESRYRTLFESMEDGFCILDVLFDDAGQPVDYRFVEVNPAFEQQTGLQEAEGKTARQLVPGLESHWFDIYGRVVRTREPVRFESGSDVMGRWFEVYAFLPPLQSHNRVAALFREISDRKRAELALRESEERFRTLADNISQFTWMADPNGWIFWYNQRWFDYTGTTLEDMQGWGWQQVHHPDHVERVVTKIRHCFTTGTPWEDTFPLRGKDGRYRWFLSRALPIWDNNGTILRWFGSNTDITELRQAEQTLAERAVQQAAIARIGQQALPVNDLDRFFDTVTLQVTQVLQADYCKVLELLPESNGLLLRSGVGWQDGLVGQAIVSAELDSQAGYTLVSDQPVSVQDLRTEPRFSGPDLLIEHGVISGISTVIEGGDDHPFGVLGVHTRSQRTFTENDVNFLQAIANILTETIVRQRTEREIRQINASLERRVEERTQELVESNRELEAFAYSIAHDLRSPLRGIQGFARIFQEDYRELLDETAQSYTQIMIDMAVRLDHLIQDLLAYSQLGRRDIQLTSVSLDPVVAEVLEELADRIHETEARVSVEALPTVRAHRSVLRQVLVNLVSNALKFVQPDRPSAIRIWAEQRNSRVCLWVEDTGIGIAHAHQERIFRPFERLHGEAAYPGTGIGLAIVQRGVQRMGGRVGVESEPGSGSRFWIELPSPQVSTVKYKVPE